MFKKNKKKLGTNRQPIMVATYNDQIKPWGKVVHDGHEHLFYYAVAEQRFVIKDFTRVLTIEEMRVLHNSNKIEWFPEGDSRVLFPEERKPWEL